MNDPVSLLRDKVAKAEAKVQRVEKALDSARSELSDFQTALRVMEGLSGESKLATPAPTAVANRQLMMLEMLGVGRENGSAPADLYAAYVKRSGEELSIDTFRTTIWRMKDRIFNVGSATYTVYADNGMYWKSLVLDLNDEFHEILGGNPEKENEPRSEIAGGSDADSDGGSTPKLSEVQSDYGTLA